MQAQYEHLNDAPDYTKGYQDPHYNHQQQHQQQQHTNVNVNVVANNDYIKPGVVVKAKMNKRHRQFMVPRDCSLGTVVASLKEQFDIVDRVGADVNTAYLLWLFFGWLGVHRWYLREHDALSWCAWFFTGQLFGIGWIVDGITLASRVTKFNERTIGRAQSSTYNRDWLCSYKGDNRPNMAAAYLLWFFFGWAGIHRWYTGYHTTASFVAWFITGQIFGMGWLYDAYYTSVMVNYPRRVDNQLPFFVKALHKFDYLPIHHDQDLAAALSTAISESDNTLRLLVVPKKREDAAYLAWFLFGYIGGHAWYLGMDSLWIRFFTGNYFGIGYIIDGIRLQNEIDRANQKLAGDFVPSFKGAQIWPVRFINLDAVGSFESV